MHPNLFKVETFVPKADADKVRLAIGDAGGGKLGNYSHCCFVSEGHGYFLPLEGAQPAIGKVGKIEQVVELKIQFICEKDLLEKVLTALRKAHPYEEVPVFVVPILDV